MPDKTAPNGQQYAIDGKTFTWTAEDGNEVALPLRIKVKVIRAMASRDMDVATMFEMVESIAPTQTEAIDDMDINDFQAMFVAWQTEYQKLTGAQLGE